MHAACVPRPGAVQPQVVFRVLGCPPPTSSDSSCPTPHSHRFLTYSLTTALTVALTPSRPPLPSFLPSCCFAHTLPSLLP